MPSPSTLRWRLRDATSDAHARVDARAASLFDDRAGYVVFLDALHAFATCAERVLDGDPAAVTARRALATDLAALGESPTVVDPLPLRARDAFEALGWHYVLAGSSLGARLLVRRVAALGLTAESGATYLHGHARGDAWPAFLALADATPDDAVGTERACAAANAAFARVADAMQRARAEQAA